MSVMSLDLDDSVAPVLKRLIKKTRNMTSAMKKIDRRVMRPLQSRAWGKSGLKSKSGELKKAVTTFHGKKSAGISVHTTPGHDLVIPKAVAHTRGAKKHSHKKRQRYKVKSHSRSGHRIGSHMRRNVGSPWGNVPARPFIPVKLGAGDTRKIIKIIEAEINV